MGADMHCVMKELTYAAVPLRLFGVDTHRTV
jgi:hypothetical protein